MLWVIGCGAAIYFAPPWLMGFLMLAKRAIWTAAWMAFVDDVVGALVWPDVKSRHGRVKLVLVQGFVIYSVVAVGLALRYGHLHGARELAAAIHRQRKLRFGSSSL